MAEDFMKLARNLVLALLVAATAVSAAVDPGLLNLIPADAKIISGIQVYQSKTSRFGQYVLAHMGDDDPGMQKFISATGFDPRRDLTEILVATKGDANAPQVVVVGRGVFDPAKIVDAAKAAGALSAVYHGVTLLTHSESKGDHSIGFLDSSIAALGSTDAVKDVIDHRASAPRLDQTLQNKVRDLASANDAWFLSTVPVSDFFAGKVADPNMNHAMSGNLFQGVRSASGGLKFSSEGVRVSGEAITRSDQDATALADVIRFIAGLVQQNKDANPQAQQAASLLSNLLINTSGNTLTLSLSVPEDLMEQLFMPRQNKAKHTKTAAQLAR